MARWLQGYIAANGELSILHAHGHSTIRAAWCSTPTTTGLRTRRGAYRLTDCFDLPASCTCSSKSGLQVKVRPALGDARGRPWAGRLLRDERRSAETEDPGRSVALPLGEPSWNVRPVVARGSAGLGQDDRDGRLSQVLLTAELRQTRLELLAGGGKIC